MTKTQMPQGVDNPIRPATITPLSWHREDSRLEEIIGTLCLIAALLAWIAGIHWLAWLLFVKSAMDHVFAIAYACIEIALRKKNRKTPN